MFGGRGVWAAGGGRVSKEPGDKKKRGWAVWKPAVSTHTLAQGSMFRAGYISNLCST